MVMMTKKIFLIASLLFCALSSFAKEDSYSNKGESILLAQGIMPVWQKYADVKVLCDQKFYMGTVYICQQNHTTYVKLKVNGQEFTDIETCSYYGIPRGELADTSRDRYYNYCAAGKYYFYLH